MKKLISLKWTLLLAGILSCTVLSNCSKIEESTIDNSVPIPTLLAQTRAAEFHWRCAYCGFLNRGGRSTCAACNKEYNGTHSRLILNLFDLVGNKVKTTIEGENGGAQWIQVTPTEFAAYLPEPWYETSGAMKYYNDLKNSSTYKLTPGYAEGVDFAWYRTTHILYPGLHDRTKVESTFTKFRLRESKNFEGFNGQGLLDGSEAAVKAFVNYR